MVEQNEDKTKQLAFMQTVGKYERQNYFLWLGIGLIGTVFVAAGLLLVYFNMPTSAIAPEKWLDTLAECKDTTQTSVLLLSVGGIISLARSFFMVAHQKFVAEKLAPYRDEFATYLHTALKVKPVTYGAMEFLLDPSLQKKRYPLLAASYLTGCVSIICICVWFNKQVEYGIAKAVLSGNLKIEFNFRSPLFIAAILFLIIDFIIGIVRSKAESADDRRKALLTRLHKAAEQSAEA